MVDEVTVVEWLEEGEVTTREITSSTYKRAQCETVVWI